MNNQINEGKIVGVLTKTPVKLRPNVITLMVQIEKTMPNGGKMPMYPSFVAYSDMAEDIEEMDIPANANVEITYELETRRKNRDGKKFYYENKVIKDIKVI